MGPVNSPARKWNGGQEREGAALDAGRGEEVEYGEESHEQETEGRKGYEVGRVVKFSWDKWVVMASEREGEIFNVQEDEVRANHVH